MTLPEEVKTIVEQEIRKLKQLGPRNQEYHVGMNYLQTISDLPWGVKDSENTDTKAASEVLERDHFGLDAVKTRII
jgi:ATP-dependent Lon protease